MRTYLPRAHGNRQRVCLSHLCCCWIGVWRKKEKPFLPHHVPMHPPLTRLGTALCLPPTATVQGQLPHCWGKATPATGRPSCQPQDGEQDTLGGCGTYPKQGAPFSPLQCPFPPPCHGMEPVLLPGHSAQSPFLLPQGQTTARKNTPEPEQGASVGTGCPVPGSVQQTCLVPSPCPVSPGRHGGLPWTALANGGRCQPCRWVPRVGCPAVEGLSAPPAASGDV